MDAFPFSGPAEDQPDNLPLALQLARDGMRFAKPVHGSPVVITGISIPYTQLAAFFMKLALAAVPALFLLGVIIFGLIELWTSISG